MIDENWVCSSQRVHCPKYLAVRLVRSVYPNHINSESMSIKSIRSPTMCDLYESRGFICQLLNQECHSQFVWTISFNKRLGCLEQFWMELFWFQLSLSLRWFVWTGLSIPFHSFLLYSNFHWMYCNANNIKKEGNKTVTGTQGYRINIQIKLFFQLLDWTNLHLRFRLKLSFAET